MSLNICPLTLEILSLEDRRDLGPPVLKSSGTLSSFVVPSSHHLPGSLHPFFSPRRKENSCFLHRALYPQPWLPVTLQVLWVLVINQEAWTLGPWTQPYLSLLSILHKVGDAKKNISDPDGIGPLRIRSFMVPHIKILLD